MGRAKNGFTLVELIVVIVVLGILAATALPRFLNLTDDAHSAAVSGVGGAMAAAVNITHAGWLADGGTAAINSVTLEGGQVVNVSDEGWPGDDAIIAQDCVDLWGDILQNAPTADSVDGATEDYYATAADPSCTFRYEGNGAGTMSITYNSSTGQVTIDDTP